MVKEMDTFMLLVCTYGCSTTVINVARAMCYSRLVECLCEKWDELSAGSISLFCKLPGIRKCDLDNEEEFQNMLLLAKSMGVQHVEVVVELKSGIGRSSSSGSLRGYNLNDCVEHYFHYGQMSDGEIISTVNIDISKH
ncbi:uncharacterized protein LOC114263107 [Camellia sinensis]|uniref:uncharacterized protein LOC114263107 n=1 Tax=Camellia sinensis TaxID=4442 RepID=UPI001036BE80|nr:uncharacterized protein LOC114263107 [Camellia sinensis]